MTKILITKSVLEFLLDFPEGFTVESISLSDEIVSLEVSGGEEGVFEAVYAPDQYGMVGLIALDPVESE